MSHKRPNCRQTPCGYPTVLSNISGEVTIEKTRLLQGQRDGALWYGLSHVFFNLHGKLRKRRVFGVPRTGGAEVEELMRVHPGAHFPHLIGSVAKFRPTQVTRCK